eukprot:451243_1
MSSKVKFHVRKKRVKSSPIRTTKEQRKKQKAAKRKKKRLLSQQTQNKQRTTTKRLKLILRPNSNVSNHNHHPQRNNNSRVAVRSRSSQFDLDTDSEGITRSSTLSIVALLGFQTIFSNNNQNHLPIESSQNITALKECSERVLGFQSETADDMSITRVLMNTIFAVQAMGIQFVDKYYHYLFTLELQQWIRIVTQLQGVYDIMIIDMRQRLSLQKYPEDRPIPKAALSSNDCCETSNGGAQHYQGKGPNMRDSTRAGHVCSDMNDPWYTIDHMIQ